MLEERNDLKKEMLSKKEVELKKRFALFLAYPYHKNVVAKQQFDREISMDRSV